MTLTRRENLQLLGLSTAIATAGIAFQEVTADERTVLSIDETAEICAEDNKSQTLEQLCDEHGFIAPE